MAHRPTLQWRWVAQVEVEVVPASQALPQAQVEREAITEQEEVEVARDLMLSLSLEREGQELMVWLS